MKDRIRQIMEHLGLSQQDFAGKLGISPASLSSIFTGRTNPTNNHVMAIHQAFPDISVNWIMFGEGEMYENASSSSAPSYGEGGQSGDGFVGIELAPATGPTMPSLFSEAEMASTSPRSASPSPSSNNYGRAASRRNSPEVPSSAQAASVASLYGQRPLNGLPTAVSEKYLDKPVRRIKEIRVFYDDGTYESFVPSSK